MSKLIFLFVILAVSYAVSEPVPAGNWIIASDSSAFSPDKNKAVQMLNDMSNGAWPHMQMPQIHMPKIEVPQFPKLNFPIFPKISLPTSEEIKKNFEKQGGNFQGVASFVQSSVDKDGQKIVKGETILKDGDEVKTYKFGN